MNLPQQMVKKVPMTEFIMTAERKRKKLERRQKITHQHTIELAKALGESDSAEDKPTRDAWEKLVELRKKFDEKKNSKKPLSKS